MKTSKLVEWLQHMSEELSEHEAVRYIECSAQLEQQQSRIEALEATLVNLIAQHCTSKFGEFSRDEECLDSYALTVNADAMRLLAEAGYIKVIREHGRRVIGNWTKEGKEQDDDSK